MTKQPRLRFSDAERADPALKKPIRKADQAAKKADKAQAKLPKKTVKSKKQTVDPETGQQTVRLIFEEGVKKRPPSKLEHTLRSSPGQIVAGQFHREIHSSEDDNVGVESAHKSEELAEAGTRAVRDGYHSHKLKPYRTAAKAEHRLEKANIEALYQKSIREQPALASNPLSRWQQKRAIKKQYYAMRNSSHTGSATAEASRKIAQATAEKTKQAGQFIWHHRRGACIVLALFFLLCMMLNTLSSCSMMVQSIGSVVSGSTYPSQDADMLGAEAAYAAKEIALQEKLDRYEDHHNYDEYAYELDEIGHDPYVLISLITAWHGGEWTLSEATPTLDMLFEKQYRLSEEVVTETRYRTETKIGTRPVTNPETGEVTTEEYEYQIKVPYTYRICKVSLENFNLSHVPIYILSEDQLSMYAIYMSTLGNRPDLFPKAQYPNVPDQKNPPKYEVPPEALQDAQFAAMLKEAEKYLGFPYVWGGSSPSTSFDCSGYVSWVINHSGWNVGRLGAEALFYYCTPVSPQNARPGDLIFFERTYDETGVTHVGIYVGDGMMIHCGDPISYEDITQRYWQQHFYSYGRLPQP